MAVIRIARNPGLLLAMTWALLAPSVSQAQSAEAPAEASRHFERAYLLAQQGSLEEAIGEFNQAYALQPHPSVLYNLGQAYAASGRSVEAVETLRRFLEQAPAGDKERRAQAAALMEYQTQRIGLLSLTVSPKDAAISIDGIALGADALAGPIKLVAGSHALVLTRAGYETRVESLQIVGKRTLGLALVLQPVQAPASPAKGSNAESGQAFEALRADWQRRARLQRTSAIIVGGVALAGLTAAGALYLSNQKGYDDWNRDSRAFAARLQNGPGPSRGELDQLLAAENTLRNRDAWALGLAVFGGALGTTSLALWLTAPRAAQPNHVTLHLGSTPWLGYSGSF